MTRSARWLFVLALMPIAACSSNSSAPVAAAPPPPPALAAPDAAFVNQAAAINAAEIQSGQLAATKAKSARVKSYASKVVSDHTAVSQQLATLAQSKSVTPDASMTPDMTASMDKLNSARPAAFDREYARNQVMADQAAVKVYQDEIANGQDADVKAFASSTLPAIQQHLVQARRLR